MNSLRQLLTQAVAVFAVMFASLLAIPSFAGTPQTQGGITTIHLDQYNGYFAAQETLADLKPGTYDIVVSNKSGKLAGFQVQSMSSKDTLDMFPLEPGATKTSRIKVGKDGFRFRCPINPTPWYDVDSIK